MVGSDPPALPGMVKARRPDGLLVGFVNVAWDGGDHAVLLNTRVRSKYQRRGIAAEVVRVAVSHSRAAGCEWLHVDFEEHLRRQQQAGPCPPALCGRTRSATRLSSSSSSTPTSRNATAALPDPLNGLAASVNRPAASHHCPRSGGPITGGRVVPCRWRNSAQAGPMLLAGDIMTSLEDRSAPASATISVQPVSLAAVSLKERVGVKGGSALFLGFRAGFGHAGWRAGSRWSARLDERP